MPNPESLSKLDLPPVPPAQGCYTDCVRDGVTLYLSGKGPRFPDGHRSTGKVGLDVTLEQARQDARQAMLNLLAVVAREIGSLDRVDQILKLMCIVNGAPNFQGHAQVADGASELLIDLFGERGMHARSAIGGGSLPGNITVEIEMILRIRP